MAKGIANLSEEMTGVSQPKGDDTTISCVTGGYHELFVPYFIWQDFSFLVANKPVSNFTELKYQQSSIWSDSKKSRERKAKAMLQLHDLTCS